MRELQGTAVLVTGAGSGIGRALAERLVADGARVIGLDRTDGVPAGVEPLVADLSDTDSVDAAAQQVRDRVACLEGLANVAGIPGSRPAAQVLAVNWLGPRRLTRSLLEIVRPGGAVVDVSSLAGRHLRYEEAVDELLAMERDELLAWAEAQALDGPGAYDLSKKLLTHHSRRLAGELVSSVRRAVSVSPGPVETPILRDFTETMDGAVQRAAAVTGRHGTADEVAAVVQFLLSPDAAWVSGIDIAVDGGLLAARQSAVDHVKSVTR